ncbi:protein spt2-like isoform X2 [Juglans microcarpa x Juglans regia]|uniref:protein spt2-like isoform X2 n=1 Tax=Juglans microcarpa x Juglans regia TaxID=2249226 RepID=UPI001B7DE582|nr:protein spt2-like isoform X2 [Juglans microcarpa x Juglans regia]
MRGYDRDELHGELEDYDEYEEEGEELEEDPGEGEEEGYEEEDPKPTREELEYLELRQKLKEQIRKQMKKDNGSSKNGSNETKKKLPYDNYGSFFGNSQPVIAQRVIQESKSLLETNHLASRLSNSLHGNKKDTSTSKGPKLGLRHQLPKVKTELKTKVEKLKDTRDYSFLLSDDAELPASSKEPPPRNVSFPNHGHEARAAHVPMKKSKEPSGSSGRHEERKTVSMNGQFYSKAGSKLNSATKTADSRKQLGSNFGNGPGRPVGPKGLPLKNPVATTDKKLAMEKKVSAPAAKNSLPGVQRSSSQVHSSAPKQPLEQKRRQQESNKSKMVPKQPLTSSKPKINKPQKQISSYQTSRDHRPLKKPRPVSRHYDDDDDGVKAISMIRQMFRYNPNRYDDDGDDSDMEANYADIMREENRSAKIARKEDEEQLRLIEEEEERERLARLRKLKKRKLGQD